MATLVNHIEVWNAALVLVGEEPIAEHDGSSEAIIYRAVMDSLVREKLTKHKWSFARKVARLSKQGTTGNTPAYVYQLPADFLLAHKVTVGTAPVVDYEIRSNKLVMDVDSALVDLHYTYQAPVNLWAADFTGAMIEHCRAIIKKSLHDDTVEAERIEILAENKFLDALARDRMAQGPEKITPRPRLTERWKGGARRA